MSLSLEQNVILFRLFVDDSVYFLLTKVAKIVQQQIIVDDIVSQIIFVISTWHDTNTIV